MRTRMIELYHPRVNDGNVIRITVEMTNIYISPPNRAGVRSIHDIDINVPVKSDEHRFLHKFKEAVSSPSGIIPIRLAIGDHVGMWSVKRGPIILGYYAQYTLCFSGEAEMPPHSSE